LFNCYLRHTFRSKQRSYCCFGLGCQAAIGDIRYGFMAGYAPADTGGSYGNRKQKKLAFLWLQTGKFCDTRFFAYLLVCYHYHPAQSHSACMVLW
jgi:hypothetical protein